MKTRRVRIGPDISTRVFDSGGGGRPVVLVHGLAASIEIWSRALPFLVARRRVIAFDLPGFGEADRPDARYDAPFFVDALRGLLDSLGIDRAHLVGSSLGASLVVRFAARHLDRIDRSVLAAPGGFGAAVHPFLQVPTLPFVGFALAAPMRATTAIAVGLAMHDPANATADLVETSYRHARAPGGHRAFVRTLKAVISPLGVRDRAGFERDARTFLRPTLIVWGEQDRLFPVRQSEAARRVLPDATLARIDACGHYPHWENPRRFAELVDAHLDAGPVVA